MLRLFADNEGGATVKRLIVGSIEMLSVILSVLSLLIGLFSGWAAAGLWGALGGLIVAFVGTIVIFGALFILLEMNESLRAIRQQLDAQSDRSVARGPSLKGSAGPA
jgi:hypothetical protein